MRLPFNGRILALGVLAYIIFLVLNFPADRAYAYWKSADKTRHPVSLVGISGSVWSGKADLGTFKRQTLEDIEWSLRPWTLLLGQVGLSWRGQLPAGAGNKPGFAQGITSLGLGGSIELSEVEATVPAALMAGLAQMDALQPLGTVNLSLQQAEWDSKSLISAEGRIVWNGAGITLLKPLALGDLTLVLENETDMIKGVISDSGGPLSIAGVVTLSTDGKYQFNGTLGARNDKDLENALRSMGRPGPDGKITVKQSGTLASLGLLPIR